MPKLMYSSLSDTYRQPQMACGQEEEEEEEEEEDEKDEKECMCTLTPSSLLEQHGIVW